MPSGESTEPLNRACWIEAEWPAPPGVRAGITTRRGGVSRAPWDSFNLGAHVGDDSAAVAENRRRLVAYLGLPADPVWLSQQHGNRVIEVPGDADRNADACVTRERGVVCAVLVADCIPLLLADQPGTQIGAVHVGWRGLSAGTAGAAVGRFACAPTDITAWIGPHITAGHYEVGEDVRDACCAAIPGAGSAFVPAGSRWRADLEQLLRLQLEDCGLRRIYGGGRCTFGEQDRFFSHRRDRRTGRMAALIWLGPATH